MLEAGRQTSLAAQLYLQTRHVSTLMTCDPSLYHADETAAQSPAYEN